MNGRMGGREGGGQTAVESTPRVSSSSVTALLREPRNISKNSGVGLTAQCHQCLDKQEDPVSESGALNQPNKYKT